MFVKTHFTTYQPTVCRSLWLGIGLSLICIAPTQAQNDIGKDSTQVLFINYETQPEYPGGISALEKYLKRNLVYPAQAKSARIQGKVFVTFVVEKDGRLTNVAVLKGIGYGCDEEAIRLIEAMPRWKPGAWADKPVLVRYNLPITFSLE